MKLGMIGLGKMGGNMTLRLLSGGHEVVVYDRNDHRIASSVSRGAIAAVDLPGMIQQLAPPRTLWVMVPAGDPTRSIIDELTLNLEQGDTILDGGNSNYRDSIRRAAELAEEGLHFIDVGTSGGVWGLTEGYSMMVGGERSVVERITPIFETLAPAPDRGWGHVGPSGSGHFAKMIHNGIEYGMMQAYAEGFEIMKAKDEFQLDLQQVAEVWRHGSVIRSWLLDLTAGALKEDPELEGVKGWVADSGEGRWTVAEAMDLDIPAPIITMSLLMRFVSRQDESFSAKLLASMRNQFGGHAVKKD